MFPRDLLHGLTPHMVRATKLGDRRNLMSHNTFGHLFRVTTFGESHGAAIGVVGDNISNASTIGYKTSEAQFADLVAGGQASGRIIGSGSTMKPISAGVAHGSESSGRR